MTFPNLSIYHRIPHSSNSSSSSAFSFTFDSVPSLIHLSLAHRGSHASSHQSNIICFPFSEARTPRVLQPLPPPSFSLPFPIPCFLSEPRPRYITASSVGSKEDQDLESAFFDPFHYWNHQGSTGLTYLVIIPISGQWTQSLATGAGASRRGCHAR